MNRKRLIGYVLVFLWMAVIFVLSNEAADVSSSRSAAVVRAIQSVDVGLSEGVLTFLTRKAAHIVAYFILGVLIYNVVRGYSTATRRAVVIGIVCACAYAVSDEIHQTYVPGRSGEVRDVLLDTSASAAGIGFYVLSGTLIHKRSKTHGRQNS